MATFNPNNPFNIRGVNISPATPDGSSQKNNIFYYLIFIDVVQNQPGGVDGSKFVPANYQETGSTLTYNYTAGFLQTPTGAQSEQIQTYALPLYTNQKIDKPDSTGDNLTVTISYFDYNGQKYSISGNPNSRKPPVLQVLSGINQIQGVQVTSLTDNSSCIVFLTNTGTSGAINNASMFSYLYIKPIYELYMQFLTPGQGNAWQSKLPGQGHSVAAIGMTAGAANTYPSITVVQPNVEVYNGVPPSTFGINFALPLPDMQYISM